MRDLNPVIGEPRPYRMLFLCRGLNIKQFTKLCEGHMPAHQPHELDHR